MNPHPPQRESRRTRILVVDDDPGIRFTLREMLEPEGLEIHEAEDGAQALARVERETWDLVITDLRMPRVDGMQLVRDVVARAPATRIVMLTAHGSERQAVEAIKAGAHDYFRKPFDRDELVTVVRRALEAARLSAENERLAGELVLSRSLVFASPAMSRLAVLVARIAPRDVTVLITGESGTGKERVAESLVRASLRKDRPFIRFNCAALPANLADAELFGHTKGAFTGADRSRPGLFGEADGGTILLDEVGELDPATQGKLLRVLQEGEIRAVGEERARKIDVRVLAATHRDLQELVARGQFREDLFYRLNVVQLRVPPLRERPEDIAVLARHFLDRFAERFGTGPLHIPETLFTTLAEHDWPGNVRELENALESLVALSTDGRLDLSLLPRSPTSGVAQRAALEAPPGLPLKVRVEAYERGLIVEALRAARGNRSQAARALGTSRVTLHDKLHKYGLARAGEDAPAA